MLNATVQPDSSSDHVKIVADVKIGAFLFNRCAFGQKQGEEIHISFPWHTALVSLPNRDDQTAIESELRSKIQRVVDNLRTSSSEGLWRS